MKLILFSGTTEGRTLSCDLADAGADVHVFVATDYGREEQGEHANITVHTGRLDIAGMQKALQGADLCVDATHPYAREATKNIRTAAKAVGVPYCRLKRERCSLPDDCIVVDTAAEAADYLSHTEGNILLTTGSKELPAFRNLSPERLYPRVLPAVENLEACLKLGIPHRNLIALQGPFSEDLNRSLIRQYHIQYLVTKDGGSTGGFPEKAAAAKQEDSTLIVLRSPDEEGDSYEDVRQAALALL